MNFLLTSIVLFSSSNPISANSTMTVIRGSLVKTEECSKLEKEANEAVVIFKECLITCGLNLDCELAYHDSVDCFLCNFGVVDAVIKSETSTLAIALKTPMDSTPKCHLNVFNLTKPSLSVSTPASTYLPATSALPTSTTRRKTTTTRIQITSTSERKCSENYQTFKRDKDSWCIGIEYKTVDSTITQTEGVSLCSEMGGMITGPNSIDERNFLRDKTLAVFERQISTSSGVGVWTDGYRKEACKTLSFIPITECKGITAFTFTDASLKNLDGYIFIPLQPDNINQFCLQMTVTLNKLNGLFDDQTCNSIIGYGVQGRAVACGYKK